MSFLLLENDHVEKLCTVDVLFYWSFNRCYFYVSNRGGSMGAWGSWPPPNGCISYSKQLRCLHEKGNKINQMPSKKIQLWTVPWLEKP